MSHIYVVTDCEFDGPVLGEHSMLSFGSVALSSGGAIVGEFEVVLEPLEGACRDEGTMAFWRRYPEAWVAATENPEPAGAGIARFADWVRSLGGEPIFAAHPVALDGLWIDFYLRRFIGRQLFEGPWVADRLFRHPPLCIMSMVAGRTGWGQWECDVDRYPAEWLGSIEHTHRAIDDARGYAHMLKLFAIDRVAVSDREGPANACLASGSRPLRSDAISGRTAGMIAHPNAKATSIAPMNIDGEKRVLLVDTDLKLDGEHPSYSPKKLFGLRQACQAFVDANTEIVDIYAIRAWNRG